ncbi:MAG TPA: MASE1 domain-containing protein [Steroidobacteraceae bacterium]|nr:MASE1 domain-containing protein [Steroidobacteraceae bacterium]
MTVAAVEGRYRNFAVIWDVMALGWARRMLWLAGFALIYSLFVVLGLVLRESSQQLTILWPAAGLLFMALWLAPRRNWLLILAVQMTVEFAIAAVHSQHFTWLQYAPFVLANSIDAVVGAFVAGRLMATPAFPKVQNVLKFVLAVALGAAASAVLGAFGWANTLWGAHFLREWQLWWAGTWLGSLCVAPVVMAWAVRLRLREISLPSPPALETALIGVALLGTTTWVFSVPPGNVTTILDQPFIVLALVILAAFRLPPRWCTLFAAAAALSAAYYASRGLGPFAGDPNPFVRVGAVQLYLATLVVINFMLSIVLLEMRNTLQLLRTSGERYQNFVEQSSEAVWRIELIVPMPPGLPGQEQVEWLREHAYVAECNLVYLKLNRLFGLPEADVRLWRADVPWSAIYLEHIGTAAHQGYSMDGLQFTLASESRQFTYITGFRGVLENGRLVRIWCVARDISELVDLNDRLRQKQDRLQLYARQLVGAEERARRATAVDLHDGIGQQLVGLAMTLDVAVARATPELRLLLGEATHTVREVQSITQRVIADLSPPGLYELGLEPALKWLSIYMRGRDNLQVDLHVDPNAAAYNLDLRVLVFKLIRELLRNVVKHSGVQSASVTVSETPHELRVVVEDRGVGFEWQLSLFETRSAGFGLWSIADRVRAAAGEITVDTAPGRGCRVTVVFPHKAVNPLIQQREPRSEVRDADGNRSAAN